MRHSQLTYSKIGLAHCSGSQGQRLIERAFRSMAGRYSFPQIAASDRLEERCENEHGEACIMKLSTWTTASDDASSEGLKPSIALVLYLVLASIEVVSAVSLGPPQFRQGSIEGTVVDSSGAPVVGATVYLLRHGRAPAALQTQKVTSSCATLMPEHIVFSLTKRAKIIQIQFGVSTVRPLAWKDFR